MGATMGGLVGTALVLIQSSYLHFNALRAHSSRYHTVFPMYGTLYQIKLKIVPLLPVLKLSTSVFSLTITGRNLLLLRKCNTLIVHILWS